MFRKLKMGMVGGGRDAFIGNVHRMAARLDGEIELVAGAFSSDPEKAKRSGEDCYLDPQRVYPDYQTMAQAEAHARGDRNFVSRDCYPSRRFSEFSAWFHRQDRCDASMRQVKVKYTLFGKALRLRVVK
jgi:hypothetical protein